MPNWGLPFGRPDDITFTENDVNFLPNNWFEVPISPIIPPTNGDIYIAVDELAGRDDGSSSSFNSRIIVQCLETYSNINANNLNNIIYTYFFAGKPAYFSRVKEPPVLNYYKLLFQDSSPLEKLTMCIARDRDGGVDILNQKQIVSMIMRLRFCLNTNKARRPGDEANCKRFINVT